MANDPVLPEAVPSNADGFNWQEEAANVDSLTDGMAALSVEPTGVGYLGKLVYYFCCMRCLQPCRVDLWRSFLAVFT